MLDLTAEGRFGPQDRPDGLSAISTLQEMKTGALLRFACTAGALLGEAAPAAYDSLNHYGVALGHGLVTEAEAALARFGESAAILKATARFVAERRA